MSSKHLKSKEKKKEKGKSKAKEKVPDKDTINLLVIDSDDKDWYSIFDGLKTKAGQSIVVEKTRWENMMVTASSSGSCTVNLRPNAVRFKASTKALRWSFFEVLEVTVKLTKLI